MRSTFIALLGFAATLAFAPAAHALKRGPARSAPPTMVVIHSTGGPTCNAQNQPIWVRAGEMDENIRTIEAHAVLGIHYMIGRDGRLHKSVPEDEVGHHVLRYSQRSIAIELVNDGDGKDPFPEAQLSALVDLLKQISKRHNLARGAIVRHSDLDTRSLRCAPERRRKVDPGDAFPYEAVLDRVHGGR